MEYDLNEVRKSYNLDAATMAQIAGISKKKYLQYEKAGEIPSKLIHTYWEKIPNFPIPADFFCYTSAILAINMKYHNMTQKEIAKMFHIKTQSKVSLILSKNIPMYEEKSYFLRFNPLIVHLSLDVDSETGKIIGSHQITA